MCIKLDQFYDMHYACRIILYNVPVSHELEILI